MQAEDLYGLNTLDVRAPSILEQIRTCKTASQLEWVVKNRAMEAEAPNTRTLRKWKQAIEFHQKRLGVQVMISDEQV